MADSLATNLAAPSAPADYVLMPRRLTAENGAKGALSGEFKESVTVTCHECEGSGDDAESDNDAECPTCKGDGTLEQGVPVTWDTIKDIYKAAVELLAAPVPAVQPIQADVRDQALEEAALMCACATANRRPVYAKDMVERIRALKSTSTIQATDTKGEEE